MENPLAGLSDASFLASLWRDEICIISHALILYKSKHFASIFVFEQFMNKRNDILLPSIIYITPAYKYLKYNLGLRNTDGFTLKPIY
jgi:hypothetical protein